MADGRDYRLLMTARISDQSLRQIQSQIDAIAKKQKVNISIATDQASIKKISTDFQQIQTQIQKQINRSVGGSDILGLSKSKEQIAAAKRDYSMLFSDLDIKIKQQQAQAKQYWDNYTKNLGIGQISKSAKESASVFEQLATGQNKSAKATKEQIRQLKLLNPELAQGAKAADGFVTTLVKDAGKMLTWGLVGTAIFGTVRAIQSSVEYLQDLDNTLNEVRLVTGKTKSEVYELAKSYNELGRELRTSSFELTKTAADLYRQGLSDNDVEERLKAITRYAKISGLTIEESNKIVTSSANATGRSVQEIIDLYSQLGDMTALNFYLAQLKFGEPHYSWVLN